MKTVIIYKCPRCFSITNKKGKEIASSVKDVITSLINNKEAQNILKIDFKIILQTECPKCNQEVGIYVLRSMIKTLS